MSRYRRKILVDTLTARSSTGRRISSVSDLWFTRRKGREQDRAGSCVRTHGLYLSFSPSLLSPSPSLSVFFSLSRVRMFTHIRSCSIRHNNNPPESAQSASQYVEMVKLTLHTHTHHLQKGHRFAWTYFESLRESIFVFTEETYWDLFTNKFDLLKWIDYIDCLDYLKTNIK